MRNMFVVLVGIICVAAILAAGVIFPQPVSAEEGGFTAKLQAAVADLTVEQQAALYLLLTQLTEDSADAAPAVLTPEESFKQSLATMQEAIKTEDLDAVMGLISADFEFYEVGDKDGLREFIENAIDMGYVETYAADIEIITDDTEFERDGDTVTVYPVDVEGDFGSVTLEFEAQLEEDGAWRIIGLDISGI